MAETGADGKRPGDKADRGRISSGTAASGSAGAQAPNALGIWIRFWDVAVAFALLAAAFLMVRLQAVPQLRALATEKALFEGKPMLLDTYRRGYSFEQVRDHLRALGSDGRAYYAHDLIPIYDLALSLFLLTFMVLFILYATQQDAFHAIGLPAWARKILLVPAVLQFCLDVGENLLLRGLIEDFPRIDADAVQQASLLTQLKWLMIFLNMLIMLGLGGYTLYQWLARPGRRANT